MIIIHFSILVPLICVLAYFSSMSHSTYRLSMWPNATGLACRQKQVEDGIWLVSFMHYDLFWEARNGINSLKNSTNAGVPPNNT